MKNLNDYAADVHIANDKWWTDLATGMRIQRNKGELICLIHSELSEAMEGARKNAMDDHLPHRKAEEVELADALIRIFDYAGAFGLDLEGAYQEKMTYNRTREDHSHAARCAAHGKKW
jgi:NTP pyrophosphatase (non-canonical NTP hydrolase)